MCRFAVLLCLVAAAVYAAGPNALTPEEAAEGFRLIFDGRTLNGWRAVKTNWEVDDGALHLKHKGGSIAWVEQKLPRDFELRFEWMVGPAGNSGVHYRDGAFEYQILDSRAEKRYKAVSAAGAIYQIAGAERDITNPPMHWNEGRIVAKGSRIQHWLNGQLVADVNLDAPEWADTLAKERKRRTEVPAPGPAREGFLTFSDHTNTVWFRSVRLRILEP